VNEFAGWHNVQDFDAVYQMVRIVKGMKGRRLTFRELTA